MRAIGWLASFLTVFAMLGCNSMPTSDLLGGVKYAGATGASVPDTKDGQTIEDYKGQVFAYNLAVSAQNPNDKDKAVLLFETGRARIDADCGKYLSAIGASSQGAAFTRQETGLTGGFAAAILGLTKASSGWVAGTAALFSFAGASQDAYSTAYLFSDAVGGVGTLVRSAQQAYYEKAISEISSYDQAYNTLAYYWSLCQPGEIKRLVRDSINAAKPQVDQSSGDSKEEQGAVADVLTALQKATGLSVDEGEAIVLYAWYTRKDDRPEIQKSSSIVQKLLAGSNDDALAAKLSQAFSRLLVKGNGVASRWASSIPTVPGVTTSGGSQSPSPSRVGVIVIR